MNYFGKIFSNISQAYSELNPATLTGAIDVIVVEQEDGTYLTSPFHVRFGKMGVLRSREKIVDIEINDEPVEIHMKLGDSGEAYFLEECDDEDENEVLAVDDTAATTPDGQTNDLLNDNDNEPKCEQPGHDSSLETSARNDLPDSIIIDNNNESTYIEPIHSSTTNIVQVTNKSIIAIDQSSTDSSTSTPCSSSSSNQKRTRRKKKAKHGQKPSLSQNFPELPDSIQPNKEPSIELQLKNTYHHNTENDLHPFSDGEYDTKKQRESISSECYKSDSEIETARNEKLPNQDYISWDWGELPHVKNDSTPILDHSKSSMPMPVPEALSDQSKSVLGGVLNFMIKEQDGPISIDLNATKDDDKGIYLDELDPNDMNPEVAAKYFPKFRSSLTSKPSNLSTKIPATSSDDEIESGKGQSLSNSPRSIDFNYQQSDTIHSDFVDRVKEQLMIPGDLYSLSRIYHDMSMSLCGRVEDLIENPDNTERFLQSIISFDDFNENPLQILDNPNLVIRMGSEYYTWKMASSMILSLLLFQRPLSDQTMQLLKEKCIPKKANPQNARSWRSWFRSPTQSESNHQQSTEQAITNNVNISNNNLTSSVNMTPTKSSNNYSSNSIEYVSDDETYNSVIISNSAKNSTTNKQDSNTGAKKKYRKVLRLSSDVLKKLNLRHGCNKIMFSVTTAYQGTTACESKIFLWRHDDKIIISDIDGTITKSDVLGHILPYIGKDWAQIGVTKLYANIEQNGYKFLYLSARAIGQAKGTRDYLTSVCQDGQCLPDGPVLLSPTSLFSALHREVIEKKPEEFKISCLKDIQSLFPMNPFFAGFGNKINDTWAYKAVGIDISRIFTINHRGELKLEKIMSFKSSYGELSQFVDQMFPPLDKDRLVDQNTYDYNSFLYWRTDIPIIDEKELIGSTNGLSSVSAK
ncbi:Lipin-3 [Dermatophagoides pteronyssinus]|uniref:phosphatidate phosphatase n=1 Tax=Dermatophagoides pteronyssinus TaxID=6956 RepID=A0ABQ8J9E4_DERPT|nr:Lipin-3 [Dermatophagoides pteronyssinus]